MFCKTCGTKCSDNAKTCPNCGTPLDNEKGTTVIVQQTQINPTNSIAVKGLLFSIFPIVPLLGLILSCIGLSKSKNYPNHDGRGLAIAGIVISFLPLIIFLICIPIIAAGSAAAAIPALFVSP